MFRVMFRLMIVKLLHFYLFCHLGEIYIKINV